MAAHATADARTVFAGGSDGTAVDGDGAAAAAYTAADARAAGVTAGDSDRTAVDGDGAAVADPATADARAE